MHAIEYAFMGWNSIGDLTLPSFFCYSCELVMPTHPTEEML